MNEDINLYVETFLEFVESPDSTEEISPEPDKFAEVATAPDSAKASRDTVSQIIDDVADGMSDLLDTIKADMDAEEEQDEEEQDEAVPAEIPCATKDTEEAEMPTEESVITMVMDDNPIMEILGLTGNQ